MQITTALNLAIPIQWAERVDPDTQKETVEPTIWGYHTPISREVFEANYRAISATKYELYKKGTVFAADTGPRIARLALLDAARADAVDRGVNEERPGSALLAEIRRLTTVLVPSSTGFDMLPVDIAIARGTIDAEDWAEAESAIVFFTCSLSMAERIGREPVANALASVLQGSITSLPPTEFANSLATSTTLATSAPSTQSSVPS